MGRSVVAGGSPFASTRAMTPSRALVGSMLRSQPDEFYSLVFGGPARLGRLRACLAALSEAGATMLILSNGIEEEIEAALAHIGVRNRFAAVLGGESQVAFGTDALGKPALIAKLALERMANKADAGQLPLTHIILIDDDPDNYPTAEAGSSKRVLTAMGSSSGAPPAERMVESARRQSRAAIRTPEPPHSATCAGTCTCT